jgi:hypothetical protein
MRQIFLGFLQKLVPHRSLTLHFKPFRFWLRIHGDIRNRKMTPRLGESATLRLGESAFECLKENSASPTRRLGESLTPRLGESESRRLPDSASRGVAMESLFKFFKIYHRITAL